MLKVYPCQQRVMVRAENPGSAIVGVFVEPVNPRCNNDAAAVAHEDVVKHQPRQRMEGVTPRGNRGWNAEGKALSLQHSPGRLVPATTQIEVRTQHRCVVLYRLEQVPRLQRSACSPEPPVSGGSARVQMGTYQAQPGIAHDNRCRDSHPPLQHKRELYGVSIPQRERGQKGIPAIARRWAVPHGWRVPQIQPQSSSRLHDILLFAEPRNQHSPDRALLECWNRGIAPVRLLYHYNERQVRIGPQRGVVAAPDPLYYRAEPAASDPQVPAQDDEAPG